MTHSEWMVEAERLLNTMEQLDYKSELYNRYRAKLKEHLAAKPLAEDDDNAGGSSDVWAMTSPAELR